MCSFKNLLSLSTCIDEYDVVGIIKGTVGVLHYTHRLSPDIYNYSFMYTCQSYLKVFLSILIIESLLFKQMGKGWIYHIMHSTILFAHIIILLYINHSKINAMFHHSTNTVKRWYKLNQICKLFFNCVSSKI